MLSVDRVHAGLAEQCELNRGEWRLIEFIVIHEAHGSSVTEPYENPLLICLSWKHWMSGMNYSGGGKKMSACVVQERGKVIKEG